eukprot:Gregarina_sp_Poly_1__10027@NODE_671_length_6849_cov_105_621351_g502_i1_p5_GENE_NODE_671_length_6849_cov_105_621351_g502_i1NODE_671_length_6849_cov_105_621351_g502_i1_p5_ORF_typecomplete_len268_score28_15zfC3HC4_3/PF13920_6/1_2e13ProkRING_4/PF14447_6/6_9e08zfRING_2/PF13639_6/0_0049zfRING_5/PF14634_6/0_14zfP11/PF03854_14/0_94zfC3HC4_2/PF13923_6/1zfRING_UBOX/PF13445_6/1_7zfRING_UBOX/PF13445_6/2_4e02_NODE_671_length_6849_cov_105_621351_g502_i131653968
MGGVWSDESADSDPGFQNLSQPVINVDSAHPIHQPPRMSISQESAKALPVRNPFVVKFDEVFLKTHPQAHGWSLQIKYTALQRCQAILYRHVTAASVTDLDSCSTPETVSADWEPRTKRDLSIGEDLIENLNAGSLGHFSEAAIELLLLNITPLTMDSTHWQQWYYLQFEPFKSGGEAYMLSHWGQKMQMGKQLYSVMKIYSTRDEAEHATPAMCLICSSSGANTMVLPCRHLCLCTECAAVMRLRDQKCPICRGTITSLLQLEVAQ